jgi:hypothetical protein
VLVDDAAAFYYEDGYIPATDAKYDVHYGGNTLGTMTLYGFKLYELSTVALTGSMSASIGTIALSAEGEVTSTWTIDATSNIACPADSTEWAAFISYHALSVAVPDHLWLCDEASGDLADSIGSLTLADTGSPQYAQTATGWTRTGVGFTDGSTMMFSAGSGLGPNATTTSSLWAADIYIRTEPAALRIVGGATRINSGSDSVRSYISPSGGTARLGITVDGVSANGSSDHTTGSTQAWVLKYDHTNSAVCAYSSLEKRTGTYTAGANVADGEKGYGGNGTVDSVYLYAFAYEGADAEISDADIKALQEARGHTIPWS